MFQPLYIYGPYTGKDYMRFFLDRLLRNRPVPIPAPGIQLTSLSHVEDVASMLAKVCRVCNLMMTPSKWTSWLLSTVQQEGHTLDL